jgi:nicotinate-nucleotide adenylyltransferase
VVVDPQEILRTGPTYTIDTLRSLRGELGPDASIAFLIGADQLQKLHTWKDWRQLFDHAHICAASRPGFAFDAAHLDQEVARECARRAASPQQIRTSAAGLMFLADGLHVDLSATAVRQACARREDVKTMLPPAVLDYVTTHHLYKT